MDVLVERRVVAVRKADRIGDLAHRRFRSGQKMHAVCAVGMMVPARYFALRGRGVFRRVARIDADRDELEIAAGVERQRVERRQRGLRSVSPHNVRQRRYSSTSTTGLPVKNAASGRARPCSSSRIAGERQLGAGMRLEREFRRRACRRAPLARQASQAAAPASTKRAATASWLGLRKAVDAVLGDPLHRLLDRDMDDARSRSIQ